MTPGERYRAVLTIGGKESFSEYVVPARKAAAPATVAVVYPSADELPANLLKFYLHFSKPMREGPAIFDHFQLLDDKGEAWGTSDEKPQGGTLSTLNMTAGRDLWWNDVVAGQPETCEPEWVEYPARS